MEIIYGILGMFVLISGVMVALFLLGILGMFLFKIGGKICEAIFKE